MKYFMRGRVRANNSVALSVNNSRGLSRALLVIFSVLFTIFAVFTSTAIVGYENFSVANAQDAPELDEDVYDEETDVEKQAREAKEKREEERRKAEEMLKDAGKEYSKDLDSENGNELMDLAEKAAKDDSRINFGSIVNRMLSPGYLNRAPNAIDKPNEQGRNCNFSDPTEGTVLYHNCDVPNLMTQFVQTMIASFVQFGAINAEEQSAHITNPAFGMPDNIPGSGAPVLEQDRLEKYTGLELFGYSFRLTSYKGEWDDIRVQNSARTMSSMGSFDRIRATFKAVASGLGNATQTAATNAATSLSSGNVFGAITGFLTGFIKGGAYGTLNSILDTSDQHVFNQYGWYRVGFGSTMYNARELSQEEIATEMQRLLVEYMGGTRTEEVEVPQELQDIKNVPEAPEDEISSCNYAPWQNEETPPPGVDEKECEELYEAAKAAANAAEPGSGELLPPYEWEVEGTRKQEALTAYRSDYPDVREGDVPDYFDVAYRFGLMCVPDGTQEEYDTKGPKFSESQRAGRKEYYNQISSCWAEAWQEAVDNKLKVDQNAQTGEAIEKKFVPEEFQRWIEKDQQNRNYNAPWRRYVCTNEDGTDMRTASNRYVFLYNMNGVKNPRCGEVRAPIQDGIFGNGYGFVNNDYLNDTRNLTEENTAIATMFPVSDVFSNIGELGINVAAYATRISNTVLNMAYGTTLDKLGIDKLVVQVIEEFRDGVFYPLVALFAGFGAIVIFIRSFQKRDNFATFKDIVALSAIVLIGAGLLYNPAKLVKAAEEIPAKAEQGILAVVFNSPETGGDELCTTGSNTDLVGKNNGGYDAITDNAKRMLMCENWRVGVYNIWSYAQWGTGASKLDTSDMQNNNQALVGNAEVNFGGGKKMNNWAAYQMDVLTSGTASFPDASKNTGAIPSDFYRIVDMQAYAHNGRGTDDRYFRTWAGKEGAHRMATGILGAIASITLSATVTMYGIAKVQINLTMLLMLALMPIMLLLGLTHQQGRNKMKAYFGTLIALVLQRLALAALLAIIFRILFAFGNSTANGAMAMLAMTAVCAIFFGLRKQVFSMISADTVASFANGEKQMAGENSGEVPGYLASKVQRATRGVSATAGGVVGGFAAGGVSGAENAVKRAVNHQMAFVRRTQSYRGKGEVQTFFESYSAAAKEARADLDRDPFVSDIKNQGLSESKAMQRYEKDLQAYENFEGEIQKNSVGKKMKVSANGDVMMEPTHPQLDDAQATEHLSNRKAKRISKSAKQAKKQTAQFSQYLNEENIAIHNGEYMKFSGQGVDMAKKRALKAKQVDWTQFIEEGDDVQARPLSRSEQDEVNNKFEKVIEASEQSVDESKDIYRKKEDRDYTKQQYKDALIEAREKAGKKYSEKRRLF